ncbi:transmembrane ascorbate ferrireductase 2 isoform X2 [Triticum aestivum]|uniref:transmembrane ascorbate ferrireductase 2 isoform X2 n=1 Tax=Triticum aestivum TaxID=4565 RepID=UPI001D002923|nr:transmembrane ascorbate ferrireductase 2-like isoform X2 [Triticum aestivum]
MVAVPAVRFPMSGLVRLLGVAAAAVIVVWAVHFRGGMALSAEKDKLLIFNVHPVLMLIGLVVLNGEALLAYKTVPGTKKLKNLQWAAGFLTFWYPGGSRSDRASLLPWHVFLGVFLYVLAIATSVTGLLEKSIFMQSAKMIGRFSTEAMLMNSLGMMLILLGALVILAIFNPGAGKIDTYRGSSE